MKRYDAYKSTGIPWIPEVPEHWEVDKIRKHFKQRVEMVSDKDYPPLSVTKDGILPQLDTAVKTLYGDKRKLVLQGDYVVNSRSDRKGSCGISPFDGSVSLINIVMPSMDGEQGYYHLLFRSNDFIEEFYRNGRGIVADLWTTRYQEMKNIEFPFPPLSEQRAIVAYIERKERQIDTYIARQAEQIERLKELRKTIISHAVTRGIRPYTRFRPTGIPWIPEVPEHWEVVPFGRHFTYGKGLPITKADLLLEGVAVISYGQIHSKDNTGTSISEGMVRRVSPSYITTNPQSLLEKDDFVFADTSEDLEGVGNCAFNDYRETLFAGYHTIIARPINLAYPIYYAYLFRSNYWKNSVQAIVNGIKVYSINRGILKRSFLLLPPLSEQRAIVAYIEKKTATVDRMINACREQTELMKAYKQRLISDAVTGRINVLPHD